MSDNPRPGTTHRQYRTWTRWLQDEWNNPSRGDYYLMQIAQRVLQAQSKKPNEYKLEDQKMPFTFDKPKEAAHQADPGLARRAGQAVKSAWCAAVGWRKK